MFQDLKLFEQYCSQRYFTDVLSRFIGCKYWQTWTNYFFLGLVRVFVIHAFGVGFWNQCIDLYNQCRRLSVLLRDYNQFFTFRSIAYMYTAQANRRGLVYLCASAKRSALECHCLKTTTTKLMEYMIKWTHTIIYVQIAHYPLQPRVLRRSAFAISNHCSYEFQIAIVFCDWILTDFIKKLQGYIYPQTTVLLETNRWVLNTIVTDVLVLERQTISIHSAQQILIALDTFHTNLLQLMTPG